ncbi:preprotein translocase subunit YajC [Microlunatus elymi]|uniref:Preprotein translocase subunit YajC n=1 Tax=Microlunatus elymi TaxID=2596828 RepID=A0A516Q022_9ACTN|nr:preprotein translocase subunit YajC [Microlunatus elymi]QDP96776.1 preprotein translocase subunit YajC [Microlunatus elymi]
MPSYTSILLIVVMIIAFYFLIMRPQRKRQQQQQDMMKKLEPGTRVVTTTGIYATIIAMGDKQVVLETSPGSRVTMLKQAIGRVVGDEEEDPELGSYRSGGAGTTGVPTGPTAAADDGFDEATAPGAYSQEPTEQGSASASGLAGGAPIQEYTPGNLPEFTPADEKNQHETAPWPPVGAADPGAEDRTSSLGSSALGESYGHSGESGDEAGDKKDESGR